MQGPNRLVMVAKITCWVFNSLNLERVGRDDARPTITMTRNPKLFRYVKIIVHDKIRTKVRLSMGTEISNMSFQVAYFAGNGYG